MYFLHLVTKVSCPKKQKQGQPLPSLFEKKYTKILIPVQICFIGAFFRNAEVF